MTKTKGILNDLKYVLCALLAVAIVGCMIPWSSPRAFNGNEDATQTSQFGSTKEQNRFKVWSAFRSYGMSEAQAIGIIANIDLEGGTSGYKLEGDGLSAVQSAIGKTPGVDLAQYFTDNHDAYTVALLKAYGCTDEDIQKAREDYTTRVYSSYLGYEFHPGAYFTHGDRKAGYCGMGMVQYTGDNAQDFLDWCINNNAAWYEVDNQLIYMFTPTEDGGSYYNEEFIAEYLEKTKSSTSPEDCAEQWCLVFERPSNESQAVSTRRAQAKSITSEFAGKGWDANYGASIMSGAGLKGVHYNDGIVDFGILSKYSSVTLIYPQNTGFLLSDEYNDSMRTKNERVYAGYASRLKDEGDSSPKYSLYELYGEDIYWYRYLGEETYYPKLYDHIYSAVDEDKVSKLISPSTIFYSSTNYLSCSVYPNRPAVLSSGDLSNDYKDPRVSTMSSGRFNGYNYELGSLELKLAKYGVALVNLLMSTEILRFFKDTITDIQTSDLWKALNPIFMFLLALCTLFFVLSIFSKGAKYVKAQNGGSIREVFVRFVIGSLCLGLLLFSTMNPEATNNMVYKFTTVVDRFFGATLADAYKDDDIIAVQDPEYASKAAIWKVAIFGPWCRGQFNGLNYDQLYTQYAELKDGQERMFQSTETVDASDRTGKAFYNSANYTGDVYVPVGGGKDIRNWAAYLYSCGSMYHIDSTVENNDKRPDTIHFPMANTTYNDSTLMADTFRVIDAQMDISPQHFADGTISYNYMNSHKLTNQFAREGATAVANTALLLFMVPAIFMKLKSFLMLIILSLQMIFYTIMELFKENSGLSDFGKNIKKNFGAFVLANLRLYIMIILYITFVDQGFIRALLYMLLCLVTYSFNFDDARRFIARTKEKAKRIKSSI